MSAEVPEEQTRPELEEELREIEKQIEQLMELDPRELAGGALDLVIHANAAAAAPGVTEEQLKFHVAGLSRCVFVLARRVQRDHPRQRVTTPENGS